MVVELRAMLVDVLTRRLLTMTQVQSMMMVAVNLLWQDVQMLLPVTIALLRQMTTVLVHMLTQAMTATVHV